MDAIAFSDFEKLDVRVGRVVRADPFPEARKPAYKLTIDFGPEIGMKSSSAQLTHRYTCGDLAGRLVLYQSGVTLPPGRFSVKVVVRENSAGTIGSFEAPIAVPQLRDAGIKVRPRVMRTMLLTAGR